MSGTRAQEERAKWRANERADELGAAAVYMADLVDAVYGTDHEPDPDNANDEAAWLGEAEYRKHRAVIEKFREQVELQPSAPTQVEAGLG